MYLSSADQLIRNNNNTHRKAMENGEERKNSSDRSDRYLIYEENPVEI